MIRKNDRLDACALAEFLARDQRLLSSKVISPTKRDPIVSVVAAIFPESPINQVMRINRGLATNDALPAITGEDVSDKLFACGHNNTSRISHPGWPEIHLRPLVRVVERDVALDVGRARRKNHLEAVADTRPFRILIVLDVGVAHERVLAFGFPRVALEKIGFEITLLIGLILLLGRSTASLFERGGWRGSVHGGGDTNQNKALVSRGAIPLRLA